MKKLLLVRHAKATHESGYIDFERPLTETGLHDAAIMAGRLTENNIIPQLLVASPALRTLSTANVLSEHLSLSKALEIKGIYDAGTDGLINIINELPDEYDFIGLVGHNPDISHLLYYLTGEGTDMPTCAVAFIELNIDKWEEANTASGKLLYFNSPKV